MRNKHSSFSDPTKFFTNPGLDEKIIYSSKILSDGTIQLTPKGKESMSELINAEAKFTDIHFIVQRMQLGDTSVLREGAVYADMFSAPKTLAESMQVQIDMEHAFYELPVDVREKFNNNFRLWIMEAGSKTDEWKQKMNIVDKVDEKVEEEVNESEQ